VDSTLAGFLEFWFTSSVQEIVLFSPNVVRAIKSEKNETGGACSAYGGEERPIQDFGGET